MTDEQFKELLEKIDKIEKEIKAGQWQHLFKPPQPIHHYYPAWPYYDHTGAPIPRMPQTTD